MALHRSITMLRIATGLGLPRRQLCISQWLRSRLGCRIPLRQMGAHAREITSELRLCHGANIDGTHATRQQRPAVGYARHRGIPLRCQGRFSDCNRRFRARGCDPACYKLAPRPLPGLRPRDHDPQASSDAEVADAVQASIRSNFLEDVLPMPPSPSALMGRARELVVRGSVDLEAVLRGRK